MANEEVTAPTWETSGMKQQHEQDFQKVRNPTSPAGVEKIF